MKGVSNQRKSTSVILLDSMVALIMVVFCEQRSGDEIETLIFFAAYVRILVQLYSEINDL